MPDYQAPGVYIKEEPGPIRPIEALATSMACFLGSFPRQAIAPLQPIVLNSFVQLNDVWSQGSPETSHVVLALYGFFLNGGTHACIVNIGDASAVTQAHLQTLDPRLDVQLIAAPGFTDADSHAAILAYCAKRRDMFAILDLPKGPLTQAQLAAVSQGGVVPDADPAPGQGQGGFGAAYAPWIRIQDPLNKQDDVDTPPSGFVAGCMAKADALRGVHKAPANVSVQGARGLANPLDAAAEARLVQARVNPIVDRDGVRIWGARTLASPEDQFTYVPVRRLVTMIEKSISQGLRWCAFEPNDEALWRSVGRDVTAFLAEQWRMGALFGTTLEDAVFVKCDETTTTLDDIANGRLKALVGIAPVRPAEFIVLNFDLSADGPKE